MVANLSGSTETGTYHTRSFGILAQNIARAVRGGKSALAMVDRYATRDVLLGGTVVRRADQVTVSITGADRDPALFGDPDVYDPSRVNVGKHLAFAHGPHFCVGAHLARLETELAATAIIELPGLWLSGHAVPRGVVFRKPPQLYATWEVT